MISLTGARATKVRTVLKTTSQKNPKTVRGRTANKTLEPETLRAYEAALCDPFALIAEGARVPDVYSCPTITRHITKSFTLTTNGSGDADCIVLPSAYHHALSPRNCILSGVTWNLMSGATAVNALIQTTTANLSASLINYRIVGYGVRVYAVSSMTNNAGRVVVSTVPIASNVNDKTATIGGQATNHNNPGADAAGTLAAYGIPSVGGYVDINSLPSLPNTMEASVINLAERQMLVCPKVTSPEAFTFKETQDNSIGFNAANQTSLSYISAGDASYMRIAGHEAVVIGVSGAPNNTAVMQVEVIYHLEGTPFLGTSGVVSDVPQAFVKPLEWLNILEKVSSLPSFRISAEALGNTVYPGLGSLAMRLF